MTTIKSKKDRAETAAESCPICLGNYTSILKKKVICKFCKADTCSKCIERYLLDSIEDAHCHYCRVNYNDEILREICTKTYLQQTYFKHRQNILINRERTNLPGLQDAAIQERKAREEKTQILAIRKEMETLYLERDKWLIEYNRIYTEYYSNLTAKKTAAADVSKRRLDELLVITEKLRQELVQKQDSINRIKWPDAYDTNGLRTRVQNNNGTNTNTNAKDDEKKKFIRRCTRDGCQGFLSTAWKCGICEHYTCNKCFVIKTTNQDDPHECLKEDLETAELIRKDSKPCPNCGEFISKIAGCSQMFCITCKTPWDWNTGKVVTSGILHNPHYFEWMKRTGGGDAPRNPADMPCGGYPTGWELRRMPKGLDHKFAGKFYEFYRICQELQDIGTRTYRSHIDADLGNKINIKFLLGDYDEKRWGQLLAKNERKKKRDAEVQEVFGAFRMISVELINRVQNFSQGPITLFTHLPVPDAYKFLKDLYVEIDEFIAMINEAMRQVSINHKYVVPYFIIENGYYRIATKNFSDETKKKRMKKMEDSDESDESEIETHVPQNKIIESTNTNEVTGIAGIAGIAGAGIKREYLSDSESDSESAIQFHKEDKDLQRAIEASLK